MLKAVSKNESYISLSQISKNTGINRGLLQYYITKGAYDEQPRTMKFNGVRMIELNCAVALLKDLSLRKSHKKYLDPVRVEAEINRLKGVKGYDPALHN